MRLFFLESLESTCIRTRELDVGFFDDKDFLKKTLLFVEDMEKVAEAKKEQAKLEQAKLEIDNLVDHKEKICEQPSVRNNASASGKKLEFADNSGADVE
ncbi:unnamed protein product, partial [Amoebophrya sp. A25]|eukprot:GSA25T00010161001.1